MLFISPPLKSAAFVSLSKTLSACQNGRKFLDLARALPIPFISDILKATADKAGRRFCAALPEQSSVTQNRGILADNSAQSEVAA